MASGVRTLDLPNGEQPIRIGRSRNQALVIDWAHQGVSGHHIDILARDASGAAVVVHGDNGVSVDGTRHPPGTRFHWNVGQTMILGRAIHQEPECALTLARRDST
jgi:pSer/pThr/pTyr-binding forkhead associated (FHA) protein